MRDRQLDALFAPGTLSEIAITADLGALRIHGVIDRLVIEDDRVLAVDFKTNRTVPETPQACPEGILRQMGAYAAALAGMYPGKRIETAILWTRTPVLMPLPPDLTESALRRATEERSARDRERGVTRHAIS